VVLTGEGFVATEDDPMVVTVYDADGTSNARTVSLTSVASTTETNSIDLSNLTPALAVATYKVKVTVAEVDSEQADLTQGANARIGPAGAADPGPRSHEAVDRVGEHTLDGHLPRLDLPAVIVTAVVGNRQDDVAKSHLRRLQP